MSQLHASMQEAVMSKSGFAAALPWGVAPYCASANPPVRPMAKIKTSVPFIETSYSMDCERRDTWIPRDFTPHRRSGQLGRRFFCCASPLLEFEADAKR